MRDLIFVSDEDWDEVWRRNQFLCAGLCQRFPNLRILFVARARNFPLLVARGRWRDLWRAWREPATSSAPGYPQVLVTRAPKLSLDSFAPLRRLNEWALRRHLKRESRHHLIFQPLLWLNRHDAYHLTGRLNEAGVIYDITDDWTQFGTPAQRRLTTSQDKYLCQHADLTIVCSQTLFESRRARCDNLLLLPNGVHAEHYRDLEKQRAVAPRYQAPVFGYTGTLHPERVDVELILSLAREFPEGSVVLVGPSHFNTATHARLASAKNIHHVGAVPYHEIPRHMAAFDVCIVPHLETPFTQSLNPLKLWEYLACGKPIASTDVAGFREYGALCHIGSGQEQFLDACRAALAETGDQQRAVARQEIAGPHSWDARLDTLLKALEPWNA